MNFEQTVNVLMSLPRNHSVLIVGPHGIGKSDAVRLAAKLMGIPCIDQRLSQCDVGDIKGMPFLSGARTYFAPPEWFPLRKEDAEELRLRFNLDSVLIASTAGILFLDELDRSVREVQQAAFELALDHRLNMRNLPEDWRVVAAINQDGDIYHVNEMDPAFIDRFFVINFKPSQEEWFRFARKDERIHYSIIEYLTQNTKDMDPTKEIIEANPGQKLYSRRSWERFSQAILNNEKLFEAKKTQFSLFDKSPASLALLTLLGQGYLGTATGVKFRNWIETSYNSLNADIILNSFTDEVEKKIKKIVADNRSVELGAYNDLIVNYVEDKKVKSLNAKQSKNLLRYVNTIPNEVVASFWKVFQSRCKAVAHDWYNGLDKVEVTKRIVAVLVNPATGKGNNNGTATV